MKDTHEELRTGLAIGALFAGGCYGVAYLFLKLLHVYVCQ